MDVRKVARPDPPPELAAIAFSTLGEAAKADG
jgi:hypothetical protein